MNELKQQWTSLREAQPGLRIRDAAFRLGVPEAALLETRTGDGVRRLRADVRAICAALPKLGTVMSLVRNEAAVHEKDVAFGPADGTEDALRFEGGTFVLAVDPAAIAHAFHVEDAAEILRVGAVHDEGQNGAFARRGADQTQTGDGLESRRGPFQQAVFVRGDGAMA